MKRRELFAAVAGTAVLPLLVGRFVEFQTGDVFTWHGWTLCWTGWRHVANQFVEVGAWYAARTHSEAEPPIWVATTHGRCHEMRSIWQMFDLAREDGWPLVSPMTSDAERDAVKARARDVLLKRLEQAADGDA